MATQLSERMIYNEIDGLPDPSANLRLFGHNDAENELAAAFASGRMHHAWLINGLKGIGKATLAYRFANHIFHHSRTGDTPTDFLHPQADDRDHRQMAAGAHPNLIHLARPYDSKTKSFKTTLSVDEIRRTHAFFGMTATGGGWRIAIVDPAEDMNTSAANALLKILEEPPAKSLFLLVCNAPGQLLPTIRSRCREINVRSLDHGALESALGHLYGADNRFKGDISTIEVLSEGSVRKAIQLIEGDGLKNYKAFLRLISMNGNKPVNWPEIHRLAEGLALKANAEAYGLFLDMVMGFLARRVRGITEPVAEKELQQYFQSVPLARWADVWEKVQHSSGIAEAFNLGKKQVILNVFQYVLEARI
jgi:DNA polymerase-3 subunit delta'